MNCRFSDDGPILVDAASPDFHAALSGDVAYGGAFVPGCHADKGTKLKLRISLPSGDVVKAEGRVLRLRDNVTNPGCGVAWMATKEKSVEAVRRWLAR